MKTMQELFTEDNYYPKYDEMTGEQAQTYISLILAEETDHSATVTVDTKTGEIAVEPQLLEYAAYYTHGSIPMTFVCGVYGGYEMDENQIKQFIYPYRRLHNSSKLELDFSSKIYINPLSKMTWLLPEGEYTPISVTFDGNLWCALYGENLQEGITGWGDTREEACTNLIKSMLEVVV